MSWGAEEHPDDALIKAFGQGRLSLEESARWEGHFAFCPVCVEKLGDSGKDTFTDLIRAGWGNGKGGGDLEETVFLGSGSGSGSGDRGTSAFSELPAELTTHGRYTLVRKLGQGGMGVVYQANHRIMKRSVALKVIRPDLVATPSAVGRFRRESQAAAHLSHPNIVTALDAEEIAGVHFLVMELIEGETLEQRVRERGVPPIAHACDWVRQAALGLHYAHTRGMIHRDIKPANLMITDSGVVKILDFGLAYRCVDEGASAVPALTQVGVRLGTERYSAPEQLLGSKRVTAAADQYGLGATLAFLLTGAAPDAPDPARPIELPSHIPVPVSAIVRRLTAFSPEDRFPSAEAAAKALAEWSDARDEPLPPDPPKDVPGRGRRRAVLVASGVAVLGCVAVALFLAFSKFSGLGRIAEVSHPPVVFLLPSSGLWYEDYAPARAVLENAGLKVIAATPDGKSSELHPSSMAGQSRRPKSAEADIGDGDLALSLAKTDYAAIVCVGYDHHEYTSGDTPVSRTVMELLRSANREGKWLVGICAGQNVIYAAGLARGKRVSRPGEFVNDPQAAGAIPQPDQTLVIDGRLITASRPDDAAAAAAALVAGLERSGQ